MRPKKPKSRRRKPIRPAMPPSPPPYCEGMRLHKFIRSGVEYGAGWCKCGWPSRVPLENLERYGILMEPGSTYRVKKSEWDKHCEDMNEM